MLATHVSQGVGLHLKMVTGPKTMFKIWKGATAGVEDVWIRPSEPVYMHSMISNNISVASSYCSHVTHNTYIYDVYAAYAMILNSH